MIRKLVRKLRQRFAYAHSYYERSIHIENEEITLTHTDSGHQDSFNISDVVEIRVAETNDFLGGTVSFHFELADGIVHILYEGSPGLLELQEYLHRSLGVILKFDVPPKPVTLFKR